MAKRKGSTKKKSDEVVSVEKVVPEIEEVEEVAVIDIKDEIFAAKTTDDMKAIGRPASGHQMRKFFDEKLAVLKYC